MLKVTNFFFKTSALLLKYSETRKNRGWLEVLHPDHIRCIHIHIMIDNPPPASVEDCSQADIASLYQHVTMIVSHPTALRELVITGWDEDVRLRLERRIPLPSLRIYDGPSRLFEVLHTGKDLRTLTLHGDPWTALFQLKPQSSSIGCMELHVDTFSSTDLALIKRMFTLGIRINYLGMHAIFSDSDTVSSFTMFAISTCLMFTLQMYELNEACMVPGPGMKALSYSYLHSPPGLRRM
jgi:hypothetical protein